MKPVSVPPLDSRSSGNLSLAASILPCCPSKNHLLPFYYFHLTLNFFLLPIQIWIHARFFSFLRYFQFPISLRRVINRKILKKPVKRRIYLMGIQRFISCPESLFSLPTRSADANAAGYRNSSSSVTW